MTRDEIQRLLDRLQENDLDRQIELNALELRFGPQARALAEQAKTPSAFQAAINTALADVNPEWREQNPTGAYLAALASIPGRAIMGTTPGKAVERASQRTTEAMMRDPGYGDRVGRVTTGIPWLDTASDVGGSILGQAALIALASQMVGAGGAALAPHVPSVPPSPILDRAARGIMTATTKHALQSLSAPEEAKPTEKELARDIAFHATAGPAAMAIGKALPATMSPWTAEAIKGAGSGLASGVATMPFAEEDENHLKNIGMQMATMALFNVASLAANPTQRKAAEIARDRAVRQVTEEREAVEAAYRQFGIEVPERGIGEDSRTQIEREIRGVYRHMARKAHPDVGGTAQDFQKLTAARDNALAYLEKASMPKTIREQAIEWVNSTFRNLFAGQEPPAPPTSTDVVPYDQPENRRLQMPQIVRGPVRQPRMIPEQVPVLSGPSLGQKQLVGPQALPVEKSAPIQLGTIDKAEPELAQIEPGVILETGAGTPEPEGAVIPPDIEPGHDLKPTLEPPTQAIGGTHAVYTSDNKKVEATFAVVPINSLRTSHDDDMRENPDYPAELQPRKRDRDTYRGQIAKIAADPVPERLGYSAETDRGAPIIGTDMVVESGNGRVIALRRLALQGGDKWKDYQDWLRANAGQFGVDPAELDKIEDPVLVRYRITPMTLDERISFAEATNVGAAAAMSAGEKAVIDARNMGQELVDLLSPDEEGNLLARSNREFVSSFMNHVVPDSERGDMFTSSGYVSQSGVRRMQNAIFAYAYGDTEGILEKLAEDTDSNIRNITGAMLNVAGKMGKAKRIASEIFDGMDITDDIVVAAGVLVDLRNRRIPLETFFSQGIMLAEDLTDTQKNVLTMFDNYKRSKRKVTEVLDAYASAILSLPEPGQGLLFDVQTPTKDELLQACINIVEDEGYVPEATLRPTEPATGESVGEPLAETLPEPAAVGGAPAEIARTKEPTATGTAGEDLAIEEPTGTDPTAGATRENVIAEDPAETTTDLPIPVSKDDIDFERVRRAHLARTFEPETRARVAQEDYLNHMQDVYEKSASLAETPEQKEILATELERYKQGYIKRYYALVDAGSRVMNPMVTGPAKFPTARNQKALDIEQKRREELLSWSKRAQNAIQKRLLSARTYEQETDAEFTRLRKKIDSDLTMIELIEAGEAKGYDKNLFKSSLAKTIKRSAASGNVEAVNKALDYLREKHGQLAKPVFTNRHSIWQAGELAESAIEETPTGEKEVAAYDGATVINEYDDERVRIYFDAKPGEAVREALKREGWRWSRANSAWQRKNTPAAEHSAKRILDAHLTPPKETSAESDLDITEPDRGLDASPPTRASSGGPLGIVAGRLPGKLRPISEITSRKDERSLLSYEYRLLPTELRSKVEAMDEQASMLNYLLSTRKRGTAEYNEINAKLVELEKQRIELEPEIENALGQKGPRLSGVKKELDEAISNVRGGDMSDIDPETNEFPEGVAGYIDGQPIYGQIVYGPGGTVERYIPPSVEPNDEFYENLADQPNLYEVIAGLPRDVFGEPIVRDFRSAKREHDPFLKQYMDILAEIFRGDARNVDLLEEVTDALEGKADVSAAAKEIAGNLRNLFYGNSPNTALFREFEIDPGRFIEDYAPRIREQGDYKVAGIPKELSFFAEMYRTGELQPRERNALKIAKAYLRAGARKKFFGPVVEKWEPAIGKMHPDKRRMYEDFVNMVLGRPSREERITNELIKNIVNPIIRPLRKEIGGRPAQVITSMIADMTYTATIGGNIFSGIKNLTQQFLAIYAIDTNPIKGWNYWLKARALRATPQGKELLRYCWVSQDRDYLAAIDIADNTFGMIVGDKVDKAKDILFMPYKGADTDNVHQSYAMGVLKALDEGKSWNDVIEFGNEFAGDTQYLYGMDNPTKLRGPFGRLAFLFMSWPINFMRLLYKAYKANPARIATLVAGYAASLWALSKATGIDFSSSAGPSSTVQSWLPVKALRGEMSPPIKAAKLGYDVIQMRLDGLLNGTDEELFEEVKHDFFEALKRSTVPAYSQYSRIETFVDAALNDWWVYDVKGRKRYQMTSGEAVRGLFGPTMAARERRLEHDDVAREHREYQATRRKAIEAYLDGNMAEYRRANEALAQKWGRRITRQDIERELRLRETTAIERHRMGLPSEGSSTTTAPRLRTTVPKVSTPKTPKIKVYK